MRVCKICGATSNQTKIINSSKHGMVCNKCYQRENKTDVVHELPPYAEITYNSEGLPICAICGKAYKRILTHVWQIHQLSEKEYKKKFGLDLYNSIMCEESKELARNNAMKHYNKVVVENLITKGAKTRFKNGDIGRTKDKVSEQTRRRLIKNNVTKMHQ